MANKNEENGEQTFDEKRKKEDLHYEHSMKDDHNKDNSWTLHLKLMFEGTILERHS